MFFTEIMAFCLGSEKSTIVHPVLFITYHFLKLIVKISFRVFYSTIVVSNKERAKFKNPCIVVSNHPSTMMDPLNAVVWVQTEVYFLANASLFKTPFQNWFFNTFFCFPVERYQDTGGKPLNNEDSFNKSEAFLSGGGCLYIAPEGTSFVERHLRKIKTGTARIALNAEQKNDFELGLTILPVGLNYSDATAFRSRLFVNFGEPIKVASFQKNWQSDAKEAVRKLTDRIGKAISALIIDTQEEEEDRLIKKLETLLQNEFTRDLTSHFKRTKALSENLRQWEKTNAETFLSFKEKVDYYFQKINEIEICDVVLKKRGASVLQQLSLLFGFPFFLFGYATNFLPCFVPGKINRHFNDDESYDATFKYLAGLVAFPLFYALQTGLVFWLIGSGWLALLFALSMIPAGLFAEWYLKRASLVFQNWRLINQFKHDPKLIENLLETRKSIIQKLSTHLPRCL